MIPDLVTRLARLDALAKGIGRGNVWDELLALALALCGQSRDVPKVSKSRSSVVQTAERRG